MKSKACRRLICLFIALCLIGTILVLYKSMSANVTILESDLFAAVKDQAFDVVLTNPPIRAGKETVHTIFAEAWNHLRQGGQLWVVIQKKQGAPSAKAKLEALFGQVEEVTKDKGYRIFKATKA